MDAVAVAAQIDAHVHAVPRQVVEPEQEGDKRIKRVAHNSRPTSSPLPPTRDPVIDPSIEFGQRKMTANAPPSS